MMTRIKTAVEISAMRDSGKVLATILQNLKRQVRSGMSTKDISDLAAVEIKALNAEPVFLGYQGFPDIIITCLNEEVVHGIPSADKILQPGDILSVDLAVRYQGMVTDSAFSMIVDGQPRSKRHELLLRATESALQAGIAAAHDRVRTGDIGAAIEAVLQNPKLGGPFGIVRDLVGHGVGHEMHEDPNIPNYGRPNTGPWLDAGMTIAIEPMVTLGSDRVYVADDGWTILTTDGSWSAHFEHTILITEQGAEILTQL